MECVTGYLAARKDLTRNDKRHRLDALTSKMRVDKRETEMATCKACVGKGHVKCPTCKGRGRIVPMIEPTHTCRNCGGGGQVKCGVCNGKGRV